jgi:hopene-associated glycosyltransferase HpnB
MAGVQRLQEHFRCPAREGLVPTLRKHGRRALVPILDVVLFFGCGAALVAWAAVLALPWQPHRVRERLEADAAGEGAPLDGVCVLIPARDEAGSIGRVVAALKRQGRGLAAVVVDDQSSDGTADVAARAAAEAPGAALELRIVRGTALPSGWAGKLWALEQGLATVDRPWALLLDADIELAPGMVPALLAKAREREAALVSIMAELNCVTFWERLLTPPFVFFFKLLYPFSLANDPARTTAAAAGGCILLRTERLRALGGFAAIRGALIDDCTLAGEIKKRGSAIWLGMSHSVVSLRAYERLADFWQMVSRTAFTQLRYSAALLVAATVLLAITLLLPPLAAVTVSSRRAARLR